MSMPCMAIKQPWATLIMHCGKDVENRPKPWPGTIELPAEVLVLAGKEWDESLSLGRFVDLRGGQEAVADLLAMAMQREEILVADFVAMWRELRRGLPRRAILGTVRVTGCITDSPSLWAAEGQHQYLLAHPKPLAMPVPFVAGRLGVFQAPSVEALHKPHDGTTRRVDVRQGLAEVMITRPGPWGNPWRVARRKGHWTIVGPKGCDIGIFWDKDAATEVACEAFRIGLRQDKALMARLPELKGKRLGCYCRADQPCHGDVLVKLVKEVCGE
ncbi:MAG: DUF4326 domain-containing protein [Desulfarculaceae bacterium]|nr:DUF4326 domain-containing protein [Desulfarculaceae bacterium]MCF8124501.1 DUF4326 domain-containing protein [Desulfarculaceae bacterium]